MPLSPGALLGDYEILGPLGAGGMGEVYRAQDPRLGRQVAIKVLRSELAENPDLLSRFEREAKTLAGLNHPGIATVLGFESNDGTSFLVMELVEGETLEERLTRGPLPLDEAGQLFESIAEALEAAHEHGVVHRDLKPANVKITADERPKLLDFGLAKIAEGGPLSGSGDLTSTPTRAYAATQRGEILGTAAYMSPEQARGRAVDRRTDIWAFGCCLFEALSGRSPFAAETITDALANILREEPDWGALPAVPRGLDRLLRRCLEKDSRRRLSWIGEARLQLRDVLDGTEDEEAGPAVAPQVAAAEPRVRRLSIRLPEHAPLQPAHAQLAVKDRQQSPVALSPDGRWLIYVGGRERRPQLFRRRLDSLEVEAIPGTEHAQVVVISPDSRSLAFFTRDRQLLRRMPIEGGPATTLALVEQCHGACWGRDGHIYFTSLHPGGLHRVAEDGGELEPIEVEGAGTWNYMGRPSLLPGGRHLLLTFKRDLIVVPVEGGRAETLVPRASYGRVVSDHRLVFGQQGRFLTQRIDPATLELSGVPAAIDELGLGGADQDPFEWAYCDDGTMVYAPISQRRSGTRTLAVLHRDGRREDLDLAGPNEWDTARVAPDGQRIVLGRFAGRGYYDVWMHDLARGASTRLTFDPAGSYGPIWTPDGERVVFVSGRQERHGTLFWKAVDGSGETESLVPGDYPQMPHGFTPDGKTLIFSERLHPQTGWSLWAKDVDDPSEARPLLESRYDERLGQVSPDGRWLSYTSNESGRYEIYVRPYPELDRRWQVSTDGGQIAVWSPDGRELFYLNDQTLMALPIEDGPTFRPGAPQALFEAPDVSPVWPCFDVFPDGERFLFPVWAEPEPPPVDELIVVLDWASQLDTD